MEPLWADLINSDWRDHLGSGRREDRIGNDAWLRHYLRRTSWAAAGAPDDEGRTSLRDLRALLRRMADTAREGRPLVGADVAALNRILAASPVTPRLERTGGAWRLGTAPGGGEIDDVRAEIALSFANLLAEGDPSRIKRCANPDCSWMIYDETRSRTRRWCDATECGNLIKVRRFRARQRARP
jgi:predicted RNA-binding Zn ribbon-like protein